MKQSIPNQAFSYQMFLYYSITFILIYFQSNYYPEKSYFGRNNFPYDLQCKSNLTKNICKYIQYSYLEIDKVWNLYFESLYIKLSPCEGDDAGHMSNKYGCFNRRKYNVYYLMSADPATLLLFRSVCVSGPL